MLNPIPTVSSVLDFYIPNGKFNLSLFFAAEKFLINGYTVFDIYDMVSLFMHREKHAVLAVYMNFYTYINRFHADSAYSSIYE